MDCKDCIHNEVCYMREVCNNIEEQVKELGCMDFIARANVQEIKHGEWKSFNSEDTLYGSYYCSACVHGWDIGMVIPLTTEFKYCPNCGAKMDGGKKNEHRSDCKILLYTWHFYGWLFYSVSKNNMAGTETSYRDTQKSKMEIGRA